MRPSSSVPARNRTPRPGPERKSMSTSTPKPGDVVTSARAQRSSARRMSSAPCPRTSTSGSALPSCQSGPALTNDSTSGSGSGSDSGSGSGSGSDWGSVSESGSVTNATASKMVRSSSVGSNDSIASNDSTGTTSGAGRAAGPSARQLIGGSASGSGG